MLMSNNSVDFVHVLVKHNEDLILFNIKTGESRYRYGYLAFWLEIIPGFDIASGGGVVLSANDLANPKIHQDDFAMDVEHHVSGFQVTVDHFDSDSPP